MRAFIIDDEQLNIDLVVTFCTRYAPFIKLVGTADNVEDGIAQLVKEKPDLLFLDIEINNQTGFDVLESIQQPNLMVIMITAFEQYAVQAFEANAMHYLLKPLRIKDFITATERCRIEYEKNKLVETISAQPIPTESKNITIRYKDYIDIIPVEDILHLEAQGSYTIITTMKNEQHTASLNLKEYEIKLPEHGFLRVHHSHIINTSGITKLLRGKTVTILLKNGVEIPIADSRKKEVLERLM